ncbi:MAG: helix-turn-helix domain-containing protein [Clostridia bacterium]|nr:helix-turn-helix domain-containing protein [Clostridia bacterium]
MGVFEYIKIGLEQAIQYEKGKLNAKAITLSIMPIDNFTPDEIKSIRKNTDMTQKIFARYLGVSVKTVEAWESGRNHPEGAACRLLSMTRNDPSFPIKSGIITTGSSIASYGS